MYGQHHHTTHEANGSYEFLSGMLFGAAVGAAVGLLFAPKTGAEMRGQVADSASRMRRQAGKTYEKASSLMNDATNRGRDAWKRGRESYEETRDAMAQETENLGNPTGGSSPVA